jgi:hypothetical protein
VVSKGPKLSILLEHTDKEGLFAACPYESTQTIEPCVDSSRYFVLRISDGKGRNALLGLGFNDRGQAFDFKVSIQEFENRDKIKEQTEENREKVNFSLAAGQKIHIQVGKTGESKKQEQKNEVLTGVGALALAPPGAAQEKEKKKKKKKENNTENNSGFDSFPDFSGSSANSNEVPDDWVKF